MQQNRRTGFGALLTRGWRLWSGSLGTSFPAVLLCGVLPALVIAVAGYYCLLWPSARRFSCCRPYCSRC